MVCSRGRFTLRLRLELAARGLKSEFEQMSSVVGLWEGWKLSGIVLMKSLEGSVLRVTSSSS